MKKCLLHTFVWQHLPADNVNARYFLNVTTYNYGNDGYLTFRLAFRHIDLKALAMCHKTFKQE